MTEEQREAILWAKRTAWDKGVAYREDGNPQDAEWCFHVDDVFREMLKAKPSLPEQGVMLEMHQAPTDGTEVWLQIPGQPLMRAFFSRDRESWATGDGRFWTPGPLLKWKPIQSPLLEQGVKEAVEIQAVLKAVEDEPEFPGEMPKGFQTTFNALPLEEALRICVALTKSGIRNRIKALRTHSEPEDK